MPAAASARGLERERGAAPFVRREARLCSQTFHEGRACLLSSRQPETRAAARGSESTGYGDLSQGGQKRKLRRNRSLPPAGRWDPSRKRRRRC